MVDEGGDGSFLKGIGDKIAPIKPLPFQGDEKVTGTNLTAVRATLLTCPLPVAF